MLYKYRRNNHTHKNSLVLLACSILKLFVWLLPELFSTRFSYYNLLENNPNQICALIGSKPCFYNSIETQNYCRTSCWRNMAQAKRISFLMIEVNKLFFFFSLWCFVEEIQWMFFVFLLSYRNTPEGLGELKKLWKHSPVILCFSFSQTFTCVSITQ